MLLKMEAGLTVRTSFIVMGALAAAMLDLRSRRNQIHGRDGTVNGQEREYLEKIWKIDVRSER